MTVSIYLHLQVVWPKFKSFSKYFAKKIEEKLEKKYACVLDN